MDRIKGDFRAPQGCPVTSLLNRRQLLHPTQQAVQMLPPMPSTHDDRNLRWLLRHSTTAITGAQPLVPYRGYHSICPFLDRRVRPAHTTI